MDKFIKILKTMFLFFVYFIHEALTMLILKKLGVKNKFVVSFIMLLVTFILTFIFILIYRKRFKKDFAEINKKENEKTYIKDSIKTWLIGVLLMIIANLIIGIFLTEISPNEASNRELIQKLYIFAIPTMVIFGPICEEIIFRLSFKEFINNKYIYILLSGLCFGYAHVIGETGINLLYVIPYVILGMCFAHLFEKHQNIICPIIAHMIHNLMCIILIVLL